LAGLKDRDSELGSPLGTIAQYFVAIADVL
jgi:hypothetical protein